MKFCILILFFFVFKGNVGQIYKTFVIDEYISILAISDSSINVYYYTTFKKNTLFGISFELEEQKISSDYEGEMISACYIWDSNCHEIFVIVKNYLYVLTTSLRDHIKLDYLLDRYSNLILDKCIEDEGTYYCYIFISYINSKNKLEIHNYKFQYDSISYSLLQSKEIDLINSSGKISSNNCEFITCHKAKNGNDLILVCFFENDKSEIGAISLNLDTLELEKEMQLKKNSGAKNIKSVLYSNNEKVFVCYINNNDNIACIIFDVYENTFQNEFKYIEKMTQSSRYYNIYYFDITKQYILSAYSSQTEFQYILFDENMRILDDNIKIIEIAPCNDESSFLSITLFFNSQYYIVQKCGNEEFLSKSVFEVAGYKSFSLEEIFMTNNLDEIPSSNVITDKSIKKILSSSYNSNGILTNSISLTTISESIPSESPIKTTILNKAIQSTRISNIESINTNKSKSTLIKTILSSTLIPSDYKGEIKCSNDIIIQNKCIDKAISNEQAKDIQSVLRNNIINGEFNNTNNTIIKTKNILYQVSGITVQKNNDISYISSIELDECEERIRKQYHIKEKDDLIILKTDISDEKDFSKIIVQYEIYEPYNLTMIPLDICNDTTVNINIPVALKDETVSLYKRLNSSGYNLFDLNDSFYHDVCTTYTTADGTDLVLVDRMNIYYDNAQNVYLCQKGCEFIQYNETSKKSKCNCNIKNKLSTMDIKDIKFDKAFIVDAFILKTLKNSNFRVLKCYKLIFSLKGQMNNIGSYLFSAIIFLLLILMICYCISGKRKLAQYVNLILIQKSNGKKNEKNNKQIKKNNKFNATRNKINNKDRKSFDKTNLINSKNNKTLKNSKDNIYKINKNNKTKNKDKNIKNNNKLKGIHSYPPKKASRHLDPNNITSDSLIKKILLKKNLLNSNKSKIKGKDFKLNDKNIIIKNKKVNRNRKNIIKLNYIKEINIYHKCEENNIGKKSIKPKKVLNDIEMNYLDYQEALLLDKRTYFQYYCSLLKTKHLVLFTFCLYNDYNLVFIKISLFLLSFSLYFTVNSFFFTDKTMHKINEDKGAFNIIFQIPQILFSTVISAVINLILKKLSLSESQILSIKKEKNIKKAKILGDEIISCLKIRFIIFFILSFLFSFFFWYFISCFCAVYKNTQNILIENTLLSFGLSMVYPLGLNLLPGIFRIPALRAPKKDKKCLYKISNLVAMI